jgi:heme O synthase-like polyprenyltransferase
LDGFYEDYEKAGFLCCQLVKKDKGTALQVIYIVWLLIALLPTLGYREIVYIANSWSFIC